MEPTYFLEPQLYMGVDPSKTAMGYAIINKHRGLVTYGKCAPDKELDFESQLLEHYNQIYSLLDTYKIRAVVCEDQFMQNNAMTLKQLSKVTAMTVLACKQHNVPCIMKVPAAWRKTYLGYGKQSKDSKKITFNKVVEDYGLKEFKFTKHNDITDAIGMANACIDYVEDGAL